MLPDNGGTVEILARRPKILIIATQASVRRDRIGARVRTDQVARLLSQFGTLFFLQPHCKRRDPVSSSSIPNIAAQLCFKQISLAGLTLFQLTDFNLHYLLMVRKIVSKEKVDLICISYPYGIVGATMVCPRTPVVYLAHDVASDTVDISVIHLRSRSAIFRHRISADIARKLLLFCIHQLEKKACQLAGHIVAVSELDRSRFMEKYSLDEEKISVIAPFIEEDESKQNPEDTSSLRSGDCGKITVIFHGAWNYPPNRQAFQAIVNHIAPEVAKRDRRVQFLLAGTGLPKFRKDNVISLGYVESLSSFLSVADIALVPILEGTGVRMKMFDYMGAGLPIIATAKSIEGIEIENGRHAIIVDSLDNEVVESILLLVRDKAMRRDLGNNALRLARERYSQAQMRDRLEVILRRILHRNTDG